MSDNRRLPIDDATRRRLSGKAVSVLNYALDGDTLAVAYGGGYSFAKKIVLLDTRNEYKVTELFHYPKTSVHCLAFSPDSRLLAAGGGTADEWDKKFTHPEDHPVALWRVSDEEPLAILTGHTRPVLALAFSRDGRWLVTGSQDNTIQLWDVNTGKQKAVLSGHQGPVTAVAFSPDGRLLATGSEDTTVLLWDFLKLIAGSR